MTDADLRGNALALSGQAPRVAGASSASKQVAQAAKAQISVLGRQLAELEASRRGLSGAPVVRAKAEAAKLREQICFHRGRLELASFGEVSREAAYSLRQQDLQEERKKASPIRQKEIDVWLSFYAGGGPAGSRAVRSPVQNEDLAIKTMEQVQDDPERLSVKDLYPLHGSTPRPPWPGERDLRKFDERAGPGTSVEVQRVIDRSRISGIGGLRFDVKSPPGPGRLVRVPFYASNNTQSWSGPNGIETPGDDPVLRMTLTNSIDGVDNPVGFSSTSQPYILTTERFDYGAYRIVGVQCRMPTGYGPRVPTPSTLAPWEDPFLAPLINPRGISVTVGSLNLYNGQELLLPMGELDARTIDISGASGAGVINTLGGGGFGPARTSPLVHSKGKGSASGLRDYPVLDGNARVSISISAFATGLIVAHGITPVSVDLPFTVHLIAEMLQDTVFGDVVTPSPAGRSGANIKLAANYVGISSGGKPQFHVVNPTYKRQVLPK